MGAVPRFISRGVHEGVSRMNDDRRKTMRQRAEQYLDPYPGAPGWPKETRDSVSPSDRERNMALDVLELLNEAHMSSDQIELLKFARHAVGYMFHHEPRQRERALDAMSLLDELIEARCTTSTR